MTDHEDSMACNPSYTYDAVVNREIAYFAFELLFVVCIHEYLAAAARSCLWFDYCYNAAGRLRLLCHWFRFGRVIALTSPSCQRAAGH